MNMLGIREPNVYGEKTYEDLIKLIKNEKGKQNELEFYQSNHEGDIIDRIQNAYSDGTEGIVINPAAYTHTSVAIADALRAVMIPTVEVHISDTDNREDFRKKSYLREVVDLCIKGEGFKGYLKAIDFLEKNEKKCEL